MNNAIEGLTEEMHELQAKVQQYEQTLEKIEMYANGVLRDLNEKDKVGMQASSIKHEIAMVYPKYRRNE